MMSSGFWLSWTSWFATEKEGLPVTALWHLTHLGFPLRLKLEVESQSSVFCLVRGCFFGVCVCVLECVCAHLEKADIHCWIPLLSKQGTDGAVSSRPRTITHHMSIPKQGCICKPKLPAIPLILKSPELPDGTLHCLPFSSKNCLSFCFPSTFLPAPRSPGRLRWVASFHFMKSCLHSFVLQS